MTSNTAGRGGLVALVAAMGFLFAHCNTADTTSFLNNLPNCGTGACPCQYNCGISTGGGGGGGGGGGTSDPNPTPVLPVLLKGIKITNQWNANGAPATGSTIQYQYEITTTSAPKNTQPEAGISDGSSAAPLKIEGGKAKAQDAAVSLEGGNEAGSTEAGNQSDATMGDSGTGALVNSIATLTETAPNWGTEELAVFAPSVYLAGVTSIATPVAMIGGQSIQGAITGYDWKPRAAPYVDANDSTSFELHLVIQFNTSSPIVADAGTHISIASALVDLLHYAFNVPQMQ